MQFQNPALPTDLKQFVVTLNGEDVTTFVAAAFIYQEVFLAGWSCKLTMHDHNNLLQNIPIKPGTKITIMIESKMNSVMDGQKTFNFMVSHVSNTNYQNHMNITYDVNGIDKNLYLNTGLRVSKSFTKKKPDKIVSSIVEDYLGGTIVEKDQCDYDITAIIPNLSPLAACNLISNSATMNNTADFLLFMSDDGKYVFKSFEQMYKGRDSGFQFKMAVASVRGSDGNLEEDYNTMFTNYHFVDHTNGLMAAASGQAANKLVEFDFIKKKWIEKEYKYSEEVSADKEKRQWDTELENPNANIIFKPKHDGMHETPTINEYNQKWSSSRKSNMLKLEQDKLIIQIPGGVKSWTGIGKTCDIELPSQQDKNTGEKLDKFFKGKYFIVAIAHVIMGHAYFVNFECIKKRTESKM